MAQRTVAKADRKDLVAVIRHIAGVETRYKGRVTLTLGNILGHGSEESACLDLSRARLSGLLRKYLLVVSHALCGHEHAYRYAQGHTFKTGAGLFGRLGGTHAGKSGYHEAHLFFSPAGGVGERPKTVPSVEELTTLVESWGAE